MNRLDQLELTIPILRRFLQSLDLQAEELAREVQEFEDERLALLHAEEDEPTKEIISI